MKGASWMDIRSDRQKGLSYVELGKKYHMDPRTAKRYAQSPQKPEYTLTGPKPTKLDAYKQQIDQWLEEAPYSAVRILEKLQEQGFDGKYSIVKEYVRGKKRTWKRKQQCGSRQCLGNRDRWTGDFLRITWCTRMGNGRNCTAFS